MGTEVIGEVWRRCETGEGEVSEGRQQDKAYRTGRCGHITDGLSSTYSRQWRQAGRLVKGRVV